MKNGWDLTDKDRIRCCDLTSTGKLDVKREEGDAIPLRTKAAVQWSVYHQSAAAHVVAGRCVVKMAVWPLGETSHKRLCCGESERMVVSKHCHLPAEKGFNFRFLFSSGRAH